MFAIRRVRKFFGLPQPERLLLLRAVLLLWALRIALRLLPFRLVHAQVNRWSQPASRRAQRPELDRLAWIMAAAGLLLPGSRTCLVRALAGKVLIGRLGYQPVLRLGVAREEQGQLEAHAWLECDGKVLVGDAELARYTPFPSPIRDS